jgi:hypothetical protein
LDLAVSLFSTKKIIKNFPEIQKLSKIQGFYMSRNSKKKPRKFPQKSKNLQRLNFPHLPQEIPGNFTFLKIQTSNKKSLII